MIKKATSGFPSQAFDGLSKQEDSSWWFLSRNQIIIWAIKKCTNIYFLLKPLVIDFFEWSKKLMKFRTVNKK